MPSEGLTARRIAELLVDKDGKPKNIYTTRNLLASLRNEGKITLKNNTYSLVRPSYPSEHSEGYSEAVNGPHKPTQDPFDESLTTLTTDTTQNGHISSPKKLPKWLTPGTFEWDDFVKRVGIEEANERLHAVLQHCQPIQSDQASLQSITIDDFFAIGKAHGYPEIPDMDLQSGMIAWNRFANSRWIRIPDVVARLGGVQ